LNSKNHRNRDNQREKGFIIRGMRVQAWLFLMIGFGIGFAGLYTWTKQRAPDVVRATPMAVDPHVPTELAGGRGAGDAVPSVDMARVQELRAKIQGNPEDFDSLVELANINFDQQLFDDAIELYRRALQLRPDAVNVRTDLGTAMFYERRFDDAIAEFNVALKQNPTDAQTLFNLGVAMLQGKNDPQAALRYWEKLVETNPGHPQTSFVQEQIRQLKEQQAQQ
jgi:cytochrome c-type biogenesis protein CcmH/NrfG